MVTRGFAFGVNDFAAVAQSIMTGFAQMFCRIFTCVAIHSNLHFMLAFGRSTVAIITGNIQRT